MGKQRKHSNSKASDFFDYSAGKTRGKERNAFERRLQKDPFEAEAAEGLEMVSREEMEEDLRAASMKIRRRTNRRRRIAWYSAAAAVASLMIVATVFFNIDDGSMDRYKTAPEFEEAAQEQPSAPALEKAAPKKDAIPEDATEFSDESMQGDDQRMPGAIQEDQKVIHEDMARKELLEEETLVPVAAKDVTAREVNAVEAAAEEKALAREINAVEAATKEKALASEINTVQSKAVKAEAQAVTDEAQVIDGEVQTIEEEARADEDETQPPAVVDPGTDVSRQLQGQVAGVKISPSPQGQVAGAERSPAPQGEISGIVYSANDLEPLPGVRLTIKGSTMGTVSDSDGKFTLHASDTPGNTLVAQFIGMKTEEIPLDAGTPLEIALVPDALQLDEVVVVASGSSAERTSVNAVSTVKTDPATSTEYSSASPLDGIIDYKRYIDSTLTYPAYAGSGNKEVVVLKFSITPDGRPYDIIVVRSPGEPFTEEAIRVVTGGPGWKPATRDGVYVNDKTRLRIVFRPPSQ